MRVILHVDLNNFYASVECLHHPELQNFPVVVCGDWEQRHGIVLSRNEIAKGYAIKTGDVIWEAQQKCPHLKVVKANFSLYLRFSQLARSIYEKYTDKIESYGIDECWLDVTESVGLFGSGYEIAKEISNRMKNEVGLTVSIGVSFCKVYAKLGSDYKKPDAITIIDKNNYKQIVYPLPINDLIYIGKATKRKLNNLGIETIGDIAQTEAELLVRKLGKIGQYIYNFATGNDGMEIKTIGTASLIKSVGNGLTTKKDLTTNTEIKIVLTILCESVAARLREYGLKCSALMLHIKYSSLYTFTKQSQIGKYTFLCSEILKTAMKIFLECATKPFSVRYLGVKVTKLKLSDELTEQLSLLTSEDTKRKEIFENTIDNLRKRYGYNILKMGTMLLDDDLTEIKNPKDESIIHPISFLG